MKTGKKRRSRERCVHFHWGGSGPSCRFQGGNRHWTFLCPGASGCEGYEERKRRTKKSCASYSGGLCGMDTEYPIRCKNPELCQLYERRSE